MGSTVTFHLAALESSSDGQEPSLAGHDYGAITQLLHDDSISEVMVNGPDQVYIERKGQLTLSDIKFASEAELIRVIREIAAFVGRRTDDESPMVACGLPGRSLLSASIPPLAIAGASLTSRQLPR